MGLAKTEWMEAQERGWTALGTHVCEDCVEDDYLKDLIGANLASRKCDYCGRSVREDIAASTNVVLEAVFRTVWAYYCEPAAGGVPYDHGFIIEPKGIGDALEDLGFGGHHDFVEAVIAAEANGNTYVPAADGHWASSHDHEIMRSGWNGFAHAVKHETRFHYSVMPPSSSGGHPEVDVADMLPLLAERLKPLIRTLPVGTQVYRIRVRKRKEHWEPNAVELGAPPPELTTAGRMNPAGIPYLYTSFDAATACCEVSMDHRTSHTVYAASFALTRDIEVIDLTHPPVLPSIFDTGRKQDREESLFIHDFVEAISARVTKDDREHIDYVPSQVVCEYLAQVFEPSPDQRLAGLIFPSSVQPGGKNLVVFPSGERFERTFHGVEFVEARKHRQ